MPELMAETVSLPIIFDVFLSLTRGSRAVKEFKVDRESLTPGVISPPS
jgi:hypothetical protein